MSGALVGVGGSDFIDYCSVGPEKWVRSPRLRSSKSTCIYIYIYIYIYTRMISLSLSLYIYIYIIIIIIIIIIVCTGFLDYILPVNSRRFPETFGDFRGNETSFL